MEKIMDLPANEAVGVKEVLQKFEMDIQKNENLTFDEFLDAVEDCYNRIFDAIDVDKPSASKDFILSLYVLGCIVYNTLKEHRLEWHNSKSKSKLSTIEINEFCLARKISLSKGGLGIKDVFRQIVKTDSPTVRCSFILMLLHFKVDDILKLKMSQKKIMQMP